MNGSANSEVWSPGQQSANKSGASPIPPTPESAKKVKAQCKAIYDFEAQNPGELEFKEGQVIDLISQIDENW